MFNFRTWVIRWYEWIWKKWIVLRIEKRLTEEANNYALRVLMTENKGQNFSPTDTGEGLSLFFQTWV